MLHSQLSRIIPLILALNCLATTVQAGFSIDQASPEYPLVVSSADIIYTMPPYFFGTPATDLGLLATDEIDALSDNHNAIPPPTAPSWLRMYFSVTRATVGVGGSAVSTEMVGNGAAGDIFTVSFDSGWLWKFGPPNLFKGATLNGLSPLPPPQSDLDGSDGSIGRYEPVYFSVDPVTAAGLGVSPADILYQAATGPGALPPVVWATAAQVGLVAGDDIDALVISDIGTLRVLDASDTVYFSLAPGSPSAAALGTASVIQGYPALGIVLTPAKLDLLGTDDLNMLDFLDPNETPSPRGGTGEYYLPLGSD